MKINPVSSAMHARVPGIRYSTPGERWTLDHTSDKHVRLVIGLLTVDWRERMIDSIITRRGPSILVTIIVPLSSPANQMISSIIAVLLSHMRVAVATTRVASDSVLLETATQGS